MLMPLLKFLPFHCLFSLHLHIPPVQHISLGGLDCTKVLWQKTVSIIGVCVLCTRKCPLTRGWWCRNRENILCHHPEHRICRAFILYNQQLINIFATLKIDVKHHPKIQHINIQVFEWITEVVVQLCTGIVASDLLFMVSLACCKAAW